MQVLVEGNVVEILQLYTTTHPHPVVQQLAGNVRVSILTCRGAVEYATIKPELVFVSAFSVSVFMQCQWVHVSVGESSAGAHGLAWARIGP